MKKIRAGIIGGGFIAQAHVEAVRRLGYIDVVAIADINQESADKVAAAMSIEKGYGDYRKMIDEAKLDTVHVLTPNSTHFPMAKYAVEKGVNVVVEKPLAMEKAEALELVKLCRENKVMNAISHNMRYYPMVKQAREMRKAGELGDIRLIHGHYLQDWLFLDTDFNWRLIAKDGGKSRAIADIGTHWLDEVMHITGQHVVEVYADLTTFIPKRKEPKVAYATYSTVELGPDDYTEKEIDTEDHGTLMLKFSGGAKGVFIACQVCAGRKNHIEWEINGTKKSIKWCGETPNHMWIGERGKPNGEFIKNPAIMYPEAAQYAQTSCGLGEGYFDTFKNLLSDYYGWLRDGKEMDEAKVPFPTFLTGLMELSIVDAVLESNKKDAWVKVDYPFTGAY